MFCYCQPYCHRICLRTFCANFTVCSRKRRYIENKPVFLIENSYIRGTLVEVFKIIEY